MKHKYGYFTESQIAKNKELIRKQIYFLLLIVDPNTREEYDNVDVNEAFDNILFKLGGMNEILFFPTELVNIISLLEAALIEYNKNNFNYRKYRKLVLDAGNEVLKIKEV